MTINSSTRMTTRSLRLSVLSNKSSIKPTILDADVGNCRKLGISMRRMLSLLCATCVLSGCAMGWSRPDTTAAEFYQDKLDCERQALQMYPVSVQPAGYGYQTPSMTNCSGYGGQVQCFTTPGRYVPPSTYDPNQFARLQAATDCLRGKGYTYGPAKK